jgi:hypothetical protein
MADNLQPSCADCLEIWVPRPPGTLWACNVTALPFIKINVLWDVTPCNPALYTVISDEPAASILKTQQVCQQHWYCTYLPHCTALHPTRPILIFTAMTTSNVTKQADMINMYSKLHTVHRNGGVRDSNSTVKESSE